MGLVVDLVRHRECRDQRRIRSPQDELKLVLAQLLAEGAVDFTRVALDAWGRHEMEPEELLELCTTYAAVAGLKTV